MNKVKKRNREKLKNQTFSTPVLRIIVNILVKVKSSGSTGCEIDECTLVETDLLLYPCILVKLLYHGVVVSEGESMPFVFLPKLP